MHEKIQPRYAFGGGIRRVRHCSPRLRGAWRKRDEQAWHRRAHQGVHHGLLCKPFRREEQKGATAEQIIDADAPMSIIMRIDSRLVDKDSFVKAVREGFQKSAANGYSTRQSSSTSDFLTPSPLPKETRSPELRARQGLTVVYKSAQTGQSRVLGNVPGLQFKKAFFAMSLRRTRLITA
jgi:hypothetical protein